MLDIYGCSINVKAPHERKKKVETKCGITVQNLRRETLNITLWGDIARSFNVGTVQRSAPPLLAVFTSMNPGEYDGHVVASKSNHTCVFFNPTIPLTDEYLIEFSKTGDKVRITGVISNHETVKSGRTTKPSNCVRAECAQSIRLHEQDSLLQCLNRSCATSGCYRMVHKDEEAANKYFCPIHGLQKPQPSYSVNMTVEDKESRATLTVMGREAAQLFNSSCQELLEKRFSPTEQSLPEEIGDTMRQAHLFEIKLKPNHGFMVRSISSTENQQLQH